jgi:N utilization substance protein B
VAEKKFDPWARRRARRLLVQALYQWQLTGASVGDLEDQFRGRKEYGRIEKSFFSQLLMGVIRQVDALDELLEPLLDRALQQLDQVERAILRAGAFELNGRIDVPFKVVIDEYVALAKVFGAEESHRYVNAVLDKLARTERALETSAEG